MELENSYQLLNKIDYGLSQAKTADVLYLELKPKITLPTFKRKLREFASEARINGHRIIGNDKGYFIAITNSEWESFKKIRFASLSSELKGIAACDHITVKDLIKNVYQVSVKDENYELDL